MGIKIRLKMFFGAYFRARESSVKEERNSAEHQRILAENARKDEKINLNDGWRNLAAGCGRDCSAEDELRQRIQYAVYQNEPGGCPGSCEPATG